MEKYIYKIIGFGKIHPIFSPVFKGQNMYAVGRGFKDFSAKFYGGISVWSIYYFIGNKTRRILYKSAFVLFFIGFSYRNNIGYNKIKIHNITKYSLADFKAKINFYIKICVEKCKFIALCIFKGMIFLYNPHKEVFFMRKEINFNKEIMLVVIGN